MSIDFRKIGKKLYSECHIKESKSNSLVTKIGYNSNRLGEQKYYFTELGAGKDSIFIDIVSNETIKEGDYFLYNSNHNSKSKNFEVEKCVQIENIEGSGIFYNGKHHIWCYKLIASNRNIDSNNVGKIPDDLLKEYAKEPFTKVYVEYFSKKAFSNEDNNASYKFSYYQGIKQFPIIDRHGHIKFKKVISFWETFVNLFK
jgi:hypothetical protein